VKGGSEKKRNSKAQNKVETLFEKLLKNNPGSKKELASPPTNQKALRSSQKVLKVSPAPIP
jgi:hypothetical protein